MEAFVATVIIVLLELFDYVPSGSMIVGTPSS
jgi:hypothetical protein